MVGLSALSELVNFTETEQKQEMSMKNIHCLKPYTVLK